MRNEFRFHTTDLGAVRRAHTEANLEAEIQGQKLTEVITKLKGDLKTVAERNARLLRKMTEMQLLLTDASRKGLVSPMVLKEALELLKPGGKSKCGGLPPVHPPARPAMRPSGCWCTALNIHVW